MRGTLRSSVAAGRAEWRRSGAIAALGVVVLAGLVFGLSGASAAYTETAPVLWLGQNQETLYNSGMAVTPDGKWLYVASAHGVWPYPSVLYKIDTTTHTVVGSVALPMGGSVRLDPIDVAIAPNGLVAYVFGNYDSPNPTPSVSVVDLTTFSLARTVQIGDWNDKAMRFTLSPDGLTGFVSMFKYRDGNGEPNKVVAFDPATGAVGTPIHIPDAYAIAVSPDSNLLYVTKRSTNTVVPVDVASGGVGADIPVGTRPVAIVISRDGSKAYVANYGSNNVTPIDVAAQTPGTPIAMPSAPGGLSLSADGTSVWVAGQHTMSSIKIATGAISTFSDLWGGSESQWIAEDACAKKLFLSTAWASAIEFFDDAANTTPCLARTQTYGTKDGRGLHALAPTISRSDDVNTLTGAFEFTGDDVAVAGRGVPFDFSRTYTSADTTVGRLGRGWTDSFSASLAVQPNGDVVLHGEDGQQVSYIKQTNGSFVGAGGADSVLSLSGGVYTLVRHDQVAYRFNGSGALQSMLDRNGQGLTFSYTGGKLTGVTDASGSTATIDYNGDNLISSVTTSDGRSVAYGYTDQLLTTVTLPDPDGPGPQARPVWTYGYTDGLMTIVVDPNQHTVIANQYAAGNGRVVHQTDGNDKPTDFAWNPATRTSTVTDAKGHTWTDVYNVNNILVEERDPAGDATKFDHNAGLDTSAVTAPGGTDTTALSYLDHNVVSATAPASLGSARKTFTYTARNDPDTITDAANHQTAYHYNASGNTDQIKVDGQQVAAATYNAAGDMLTSTDGNGKVTTYTYDPAGNVASVTRPDPDGAGPLEAPKTTYTYNALGEVLTTVDPRGNCTTCNPAAHTTTFTYDREGHLLSGTDPLNHTTSYTYDAAGNRISATDPNGDTTTYEYGNTNHLLKVTRPDPDAAGPKEAPVTTYTYDDAGNRVTMVDPRGNCAGCNAPAHTTQYAYNSNNQLSAVTTPTGDVTTYAYDAAGNLASKVEPRGNCSGCNPANYTTTYTHDAAGRLLTTRDPLGNVTTNHYTPTGNLDYSRDANSHQTSFGYDALGRILSVTAPDRGLTAYSYDGDGNVKTRTDANGHVTTYSYDAVGRLATHTGPDPDGSGPLSAPVTSYAYDLNGNLASLTDPNGSATPTPGDGTTSYTYDAANRLMGIDYSDQTPDLTVGYDNAGHRTSMTDGAGAVAYGYDHLDRLTSTTRGADSFAYDYDVSGNVTSRTYPGSPPIGYGYDDANRLASITVGAETTGYQYDPAGNLAQTTLPSGNGYVETRLYDRAGRLTEVKNANASATLSDYVATLDSVGNPIQIVQTGAVSSTTTYGYDAGDRITSVCFQAGSCPAATDPFIRWSYDQVGNRLLEQRPTGTTVYAYNAADALTSAAAPTNLAAFTYDADGRQLTAQTTNPVVTQDGGEITDAVRSARRQGDARTAPDSSFGVWEQATNQLPNGGAEANTDNWVGVLSATATRDTSWSQFGAGSIKVTTPGKATAEGVAAQTATGLALPAGTAETGSVWLKGSGSVTALLRINNSDGTQTNGTAVSVTLSATPQRLVLKNTVATGKAGSQLEIRITTKAKSLITFWIDGAQLERRLIPTPYVETNGASGGRVAGRVRAAASLLSASQGWIAFRVRPGFADGNLSTAFTPVLMQWRDDATHYLKLYASSGKKWTLERNGTSGAAAVNTGTLTPGTTVATVVAAWTPTTLKVSINGGNFTSATNSNVPTLAATQFDVGSAAGSSQFDGDILWVATGKGTLTATDSTTLKNLANSDPTLTTLPGTSNQTGVWAASTAALQVPGGSTTTTNTSTWDLASRLTSATVGGQTTSYTYDGDGNRLTAAGSGVAGYVWDTNAPLPELAVERNGAGDLLRRYVYGAGGRALSMDTSAGTFYYAYDQLGSVTNLTSASGATESTYSYEPYGAIRSQTKNDPNAPANPLGFVGEYLDQNTGLINLRARQYDPSLGLFLARDPVTASSSATSSYAYAGGRPTVMVDPSGKTFYPAADAVAASAGATSGSDCPMSGLFHKIDPYFCKGFHELSPRAQGAVAATVTAGPIAVAILLTLPEGGVGGLVVAEAEGAGAAESAAPLFGQTTASAAFRNGPFAGRTIGEVAAALRAGEATAADLPVDVIVRNGETIGLNTRSMLALRRAGIPVKDWVLNDVTGNPAMERLLTERLARNGLNGGTGLLRITGSGRNASSLR